jgi:hypothetical protein
MLRRLGSPSAKAFTISFVLHLLVLIPILLADRFIFDDLGRATDGWILWINDGRPLTEFTMRLFNLGAPWVDFSPLPQILELICYSGLAVLIMRKFSISNPLVAALVTLPLGLDPFTLENFARKYDSLSMALSIACMLGPILLPVRDLRLRSIFEATWLVAGLCFYQASLNLFLVFAVIDVVWEQRCGTSLNQVIRQVLTRALSLVVALLIYHFIAAATVRGEYPSQISALALSFGDLLLIGHNLFTYWDFLLNSLPRLYRNLIFGGLLLGLVSIVATEIRYLRFQLRSASVLARVAASLLGLALPIAWLAASTGFLIFMRNATVVVPHFLIGTSGLVTSALILILLELRTCKVSTRWQITLLAPLGYALIMFGVVFANALKEQRLYEQQIGSRLALDLERLAAGQSFNLVICKGDVGFAPMVVHAAKRFRLIDHLIEIELSEYSGFFRAALHYFGVVVPTKSIDAETTQRLAGGLMSPAVKDPNYDVYRDGERLIIQLKHTVNN